MSFAVFSLTVSIFNTVSWCHPFDAFSHPLATGPEPPTDYSLENPSDLTQRS